MPARETEAIILRSYPLGEADRLVSFLSRSSGKMRGVAAGARRLKNRFGAALETLSYVRLWYAERETRELVRIQQCELIESFLEAQEDYRLSVGLALVSETTEAVLPDREASDAVFRLALATARTIASEKRTDLPLAYFAFWMVRLGGWLPPLDRCARCGKNFGSHASFYASFHSGLLCDACRQPGMKALAAEGRALAERFAVEKLEVLKGGKSANGRLVELRDAMLDLIEHHVEKPLNTRKMLVADEI
jgi:DNA repair protein RecO (recombination protein O)